MTVPAVRVARALYLFTLAAGCSAFILQSMQSFQSIRSRQPQVMDLQRFICTRCSTRSAPWPSSSSPRPTPTPTPTTRPFSPRRARARHGLLFMATNSEERKEGSDADSHPKMSAPGVTQKGTQQCARVHTTTGGSLEDAFGAGKGKHAGKKRRRHSNKYSSKSKAAEIDPWEQQLRESAEELGAAEALEKAQLEELEERRIQRRIERGLVEYPDEEDIDPYDPSTFGYIEVGQIQGAHGIKGEVKVRSLTDFAVNRLCTPGIKHIKAPNRRFPRDVELISGRWQKEEIFLMHFEGVSTRDAAAALRGHTVYVLEDEEVDLEENEYMVRDLVGGRAYKKDDESVYIGEVVGVVLGNDISSTAGLASDMLELRLPLESPTDVPKECYVPFVPALVPVVRIDDGNCTILMDLPEGLLDLAVEVEEKVVVRGFLPPASD